MYIAGISPAVLELLSFEVGSANHQRRIFLLKKFSRYIKKLRYFLRHVRYELET